MTTIDSLDKIIADLAYQARRDLFEASSTTESVIGSLIIAKQHIDEALAVSEARRIVDREAVRS